jgi:hypothetical protein
VLVDFDQRTSVSYVMNQILWDDGYAPALGVVVAAYDAVTA